MSSIEGARILFSSTDFFSDFIENFSETLEMIDLGFASAFLKAYLSEAETITS